MIHLLAKFLAILNSETNPGQISLAFCLSMVAGLTPVSSIHNLAVLFLVLILRVNLSAFILGTAFFTGLSFILDPLFHSAGLAILRAEPLVGLWTSWYNEPFLRITHFNNTIVMGSLALSLAAFIPLYFISNMLINKYRHIVLERIRKSKAMQMLKATGFYRIYEKISYIRGGE